MGETDVEEDNFVNSYPETPQVNKGELPDPFLRSDGSRITDSGQWPELSRAWRDLVVDMEYGGMPPEAEAVRIETLYQGRATRFSGKPMHYSYRIHCAGGEVPFSFSLRMLVPDSPEPVPTIINGDNCWWLLTDEIVERVMASGCALVIFNRTEMAADLGSTKGSERDVRNDGLYDVYPGREFGALSAWAWGYHRCVDVLYELPFIDTSRIAVTGHSRGGKTTLLAGATDNRITLINDNASCAGGGALFRYVGDGGETLDIINTFPYWFSPRLRPYLDREEELPFDQHCLLATLAPRPLLLTYALDDRWSNPEGMVQCVWAAKEVYGFLGAGDEIAFHLRPGGHSHTLEDWEVLLDFIGWKWLGAAPAKPYNRHPYKHLEPVFSWHCPGA